MKIKFTYALGLILFGLFLIGTINVNNFNSGFAISDVEEDVVGGVSELEAREAILNAMEVIDRMNQSGFGIEYVSDKLIEAQRTQQRARYAGILRGEIDASNFEEGEARRALQLIVWREIDFNDVLEITEEIENRERRAIVLLDSLNAIENIMLNSSEEYAGARKLLEGAKESFEGERYDEASVLLEDVRGEFESERSENARLKGVVSGAKNFVQRYKYFFIIGLIILAFVSYIQYYRFRINSASRKIRRMEIERGILDKMAKNSQIERFKENKISGLVYNIRMEKYKSRQGEIDRDLPVQKDLLERLKKKRSEVWDVFNRKDKIKKRK